MSQPLFILAPMDDVTDVVFRSIVSACSPPDMYFTEFVNVDGLMSPGRPRLIHKLALESPKQAPVIAQLWGKIPSNFTAVTKQVKKMGFDGVDLNMGCPQKNEVKNGCCSALINDRDGARLIIEATQKGAGRDFPPVWAGMKLT